jgi:hypothetical protein
MEYKEVFAREEISNLGNFGMKIFIAADHYVFTQAERIALNNAYDIVREALGVASMQASESQIELKKAECAKLMGMFPRRYMFREIPNQYCPDWCCTQRPWYQVATPIGTVTVGWRKSVIVIDWSESMEYNTAEQMFPTEHVTKGPKYIHAWGYDKGREYISTLLSTIEEE